MYSRLSSVKNHASVKTNLRLFKDRYKAKAGLSQSFDIYNLSFKNQ